MARRGILILSLTAALAALAAFVWFEREDPPAVESCDSCDIRHQRLQLKSPPGQ